MQADIQRTTCNVGTCHIWHGKMRITALAYVTGVSADI